MSLLNKLNNSKKIIIYGAGKWATNLYLYICSLGLEDNIYCFTVSSIDCINDMFFNKKIYEISEIKDDLSDADIIIAIKNNTPIQKLLKSYNTKSISVISEEEITEYIKSLVELYSKLPIQRNKIFFDCFSGNGGYGCNPKYIAEELIHGNYPVEIVWNTFNGDIRGIPKEIKVIQKGTLEYYKELYTSGIWIYNNNNLDSYCKKRIEQYYINTWHGSGPFKRVRADHPANTNYKEMNLFKFDRDLDLFLSNTGANTDMYKKSFFIESEKIYESGSPRNDIFFKPNNIRNIVCEKLNIDPNKKIILYAPTFRDKNILKNIDEKNSFNNYDIDLNIILNSLKMRFNSDFVFLYRFHNSLYKYEKCKDFYPNAINVTMYPDTQELLVTSDILITDYSSIMWDFSLQRKPVFLYQKDAEKYDNDRGFYCPIAEWPYPKARTNEELCKIITEFDNDKYAADVNAFIEKYKSFDDGHASERAVERIMDVINNPEKYGKA